MAAPTGGAAPVDGSGAPTRGDGRFDAIVVGAGHNGLVAAAYLARAGLDVVVLEGSSAIGGATRSEEAFPGFRFSVFSYLVSLLRPEVIHELDLVRHGLFLVPTASTLNPLPGGDCLFREADPQRTWRHVARHSRRDAEALPEYQLEMRRMGHLMHHLQRAAPDELAAAVADRVGTGVGGGKEELEADAAVSAEVAGIAQYVLDLPAARLRTFVQMLTMSSADFLGQWFESDVLKAALASSSIIGSMLSPRSPGSAYVLLHHYMGEVDGVYREWGFQKGGTGAVAAAIGRAARSRGAEIRTDCRVVRVLVRGGRAAGVVLANGDELRAEVVVSSAAPQVSLGNLLDPADLPDGGAGLVARAGRWQSRGCAGKVNLALDGLPRFECMPEPGPHLAGGITIAPGLDYMDRAFDDAKYGGFSERPFIDMVIPSVLDPDMAPPGRHVLSCFVQYAPWELASGAWDEAQRDAFGDAAVRVLAEVAPGIENRILHRQVLVPPDIERIAGIPGGNIFHGELRLSQLFLLRPDPAASSFRTPLPGYYLCGSSTQFGGGISGGPARLAALRVLDDLRAGDAAPPSREAAPR